ncbi:MAG: T9SS type A sorting domain-containing protein [Bacteroidales bacterium]|nr:T9SS type A sorting domain-containing protein [Bacteroidales bacterium]
MRKFLTIIVILTNFSGLISAQKILFDNTKSETANNADWIIDDNEPTPSPAQSGITNSTSETYWQGALSSWGVEMVKRGFTVETLPSYRDITYGNSSNSQDLSNYDVFVVCEPNNQFSSSEKTAMINFVQNGGGLFMISDHANADRDGDGWDALEVWNDFFDTYNNPFGFTFDAGSNVSKDPAVNIANLPSDPILHGAAGNVDGIAFYNGASITIDKSINSTVKGIVFLPNYSNTGTTGVMVASASYGNGRVVGVGDSSVSEDETAHDNSNTYPGWTQPFNAGNATGDDGVLITNATLWLADKSSNIENVGNNISVKVYPNPATDVITLNSEFLINKIVIYNLIGKEVFSKTINSKNTDVNISAYLKGIYFIKVAGENIEQVKKLTVN